MERQILDTDLMPVHVVSGDHPFKTHSNASKFPDLGEINNLPSMTIPDQSLSVQELVYRYTHGMELGGGRVATWEDDEDVQFPANWDKLDLSEKHEFFDEKRKELDALKESLTKKQNELVEQRKIDELNKAVADKLRAIREARKAQGLPPGQSGELFDEAGTPE